MEELNFDTDFNIEYLEELELLTADSCDLLDGFGMVPELDIYEVEV